MGVKFCGKDLNVDFNKSFFLYDVGHKSGPTTCSKVVGHDVCYDIYLNKNYSVIINIFTGVV